MTKWVVRKYLKEKNIFEPYRDSNHNIKINSKPKVSETDLAKEWDYILNEKGPEHYTTGSDKKVFWKCKKCKLSYDSVISSRGNPKTKTGCPYCSFQKVSYFHNLKIKYPEVTKYFLEDKNNIKASEVHPGSKKNYWWKCDNNHIFENKPSNMTKTNKKSCRFCNGIEAWPGESFGDLHPNLVKEIDRDLEKDFDEFSVVPGSHKKINWICNKGHKWKTNIYSRAIKGHGCKKCKMPYSREEVRIYSELKLIFKDTKIRFKKFGEEVDVFIPSHNLAIEFDGYYWHLNKEQRDTDKTHELLNNKINVIRVRENLNPIKGAINVNVKTAIFENKDFILILNQIKNLISKKELIIKINKRLKLSNFQNDELYLKILADMPAPVYENSLEAVYPEAAKKWDYSKNYPLTPEHISKGSQQKFWFICNKKNHSYDVRVGEIVKKNHICPFCMGKRIDKSNSLATLFPEIASEWHPTKNHNLLPTAVAPNYAKKVWWLCEKGDEYEGTCNKRVNSKSGCPYCSGLLPRKGESIQDKYPELCQKIIKIYTKQKTTFKNDLSLMGIGSHIEVTVKCENCQNEIKREIRRFVELIQNKSEIIYICEKCRTFNLEEVNKLIIKDFTIQEIADHLNATYHSVHNFIKTNNLNVISDSEKKDKEDQKILHYLNQGYTGREAAKKFKCSEARVSNIKNGYKRI